MITIVCGPPGAGKSTYVKSKMREGRELVADIDNIFQAITLLAPYDKPASLVKSAYAVYDAVINEIVKNRRGFVILGGAKRNRREAMRRRVGGQVVIIEASQNDCMRHILADKRRSKNIELWKPLIAQWHAEYQSDARDTVVRLDDYNRKW